MCPFEPKVNFRHAAPSSIRVEIFQRANSGVNSDRVKNPMQGNAPDLNTSPRAKRRARMFAATQGISGPSIAGAVSCQVRCTRAPPSLRFPTTLTRIPPFSPAPASNIPAKRFRLTAQRATGNGKPIRRNAASPQRARCCARTPTQRESLLFEFRHSAPRTIRDQEHRMRQPAGGRHRVASLAIPSIPTPDSTGPFATPERGNPSS